MCVESVELPCGVQVMAAPHGVGQPGVQTRALCTPPGGSRAFAVHMGSVTEPTRQPKRSTSSASPPGRPPISIREGLPCPSTNALLETLCPEFTREPKVRGRTYAAVPAPSVDCAQSARALPPSTPPPTLAASAPPSSAPSATTQPPTLALSRCVSELGGNFTPRSPRSLGLHT